MAKKRRKIKKHYTIAVTSDYSGDKTKYYRSRFNLFKVMLRTMFLVVLIGIGLTVFEFYELEQMDSKVRVFKEIIAEQENLIDRLGQEKAELTSQNQILNNTVAMSLKEEEEAAAEYASRHLPSGFPLSGSATIQDEEVYFAEEMDETTAYFEAILAETETEEPVVKEPSTLFVMTEISDVVATADGNVIAILTDDVYGQSVLIDHGNGYVTIYKNNSEAKVHVGDEVVRGSIIFVGGASNDYLGYQITYEDVYIDPLQIIAING